MFSDEYRQTFELVHAFEFRGERLGREGDSPPLIPHDLEAVQLLWAPESKVDLRRQVIAAAADAKMERYGAVVCAIVPLYVTSHCQESCLYCNFRKENPGIDLQRRRLSVSELRQEAKFLAREKRFRVIELVYASDPDIRVDTMCRHVEAVSSVLEQTGGGMVGLNAESLDTSDYRRLRDAGLSFCVQWQETYDESQYVLYHRHCGKKADFDYRLDAYERMLDGGIQSIGMGVLSGLSDWRRDWALLVCHEDYLFREYGVRPAIVGVPRLKAARGAGLQETRFIPTSAELGFALAIHNLYSPETMAFVNTREEWELCVELARGGGSLMTFDCVTAPGGYTLGTRGHQFPTGSFDMSSHSEKLAGYGLRTVTDWHFPSQAADSPESVALQCPAVASLVGGAR